MFNHFIPRMQKSKNPFHRLSKREIEIVRLITQELSNEEIAHQLEISKRTVETHRKNILRKTEVKGVVGLVILAFKNKLLQV